MTDKVTFKDRLSALDPLEIKAMPIFTSMDIISQPSTDATIEEAEKIWPILEASLDPKIGYGLAACQIGIHKKVGFVRYGGKDYRLLNTRIMDRDIKTVMPNEGCLSIPGKTINTERYSSILVEDDVLGRVALDESVDDLLCMIFQHEVDHFEGITILDRKQQPIRRDSYKIGRNDPCLCGSGKKYKKCCLG